MQLVLARRHGAATRINEKVTRFEPAGSGVQVTTDQGSYHAKRVIVTAGPWLPGLIADVSGPLAVQRQVFYWFAAKNETEHEKFRPERFPAFIWLLPREQPIYGFPALGDLAAGIKIATEQDATTTDPNSVDRDVSPAEREEMYETYVRPFFPGLSGKCVRAETCLYTSAPDARFIIDFHPAIDNVIIASPCSGHGFKHSAAIGETLALMALGKAHLDVSIFSYERAMQAHVLKQRS
jgi:sarcosine oxidase